MPKCSASSDRLLLLSARRGAGGSLLAVITEGEPLPAAWLTLWCRCYDTKASTMLLGREAPHPGRRCFLLLSARAAGCGRFLLLSARERRCRLVGAGRLS